MMPILVKSGDISSGRKASKQNLNPLWKRDCVISIISAIQNGDSELVW